MTSFSLIHLSFFLMISITVLSLSARRCPEVERIALLDIKSNVVDPSGRLSSWQEGVQHKNCCSWNGIQCSSESFHVISIDLRNKDLEMYQNDGSSDRTAPETALQGILSPSIFNITQLEYLDLGFNDFQGSEISNQFSYLTKLTHLDLSLSNFSTSISTQFSNLKFLQYLDLSCYLWNRLNDMFISSYSISIYCFDSPSTEWVRGLPNLRVLRLTGIDLSVPTSSEGNFSEDISYLWNLRDLDLSNCSINGGVFPIHEFHNLSHLSTLKMNGNPYLNSSIPLQLANLTSLSSLELSWCNMQGPIPSSMSNLKYLNFLDLSSNNIQGPIPDSVCDIRSLRHLNLQGNNITGIIPRCITNLRNLSVFDVSGNSITGTVSLISLINELNLTFLNLNFNKLRVVIDQQHLYPSKFILESLLLVSCSMEGFIPTFICNFTHLQVLKLSGNYLTGAIPSCISKLKNLNFLNLSNNRLRSSLPLLLPPNLGYFDLSNNSLSGPIPYSLCSRNIGVNHINLSNNKLSGNIPSSIGYCRELIILYLNNNNLSGNVPNELQKAENLQYLYLSDNNLDGVFPVFIQNFLSLRVLNLGNNNFEGIIPTGLGSLGALMILCLRSNRFNGSIPGDIIRLQQLQILDLSLNNLSGQIPLKLGYLTRLTSGTLITFEPYIVQYQLAIKGTMAQFKQYDIYSSGIDLSCNILNGSIPDEIGLLQGLAMLNLSYNGFSTNIPARIGNMSSLESLDLSSNRLSGPIPQSLAAIDSLEVLNLSNNNFSGRIPRQSHFDTLSMDGSAFAGNGLLCGFPLEKVCDDGHYMNTTVPSSKVDEVDQGDGKDKFLLYAIISMGFAVGFWGLFFVLLLSKQKWWFPYWITVDFLAVKIVECFKKKQQ